MENDTHPLVLDLVEWVALRPRTYDEAMEAWRTSCPRLTIWEDALEYGYIDCRDAGGAATNVRITEQGRALLGDAGRLPEYRASPAAA